MRLYFRILVACNGIFLLGFSMNAFCLFLFGFWNDYPSASSTSDLGVKSPEIRGVTDGIRATTSRRELSAMRGKVLRVWEPPLDPTGQSATCAGATS